jgi:hypothetical protein
MVAEYITQHLLQQMLLGTRQLLAKRLFAPRAEIAQAIQTVN